MQKLFFIILSCLIFSTGFAQRQSKKDRRELNRKRIDAMIKQEEEGIIVYNKHTVFGGKLISNGYGVFVEFGRLNTVKKGMLYQLEISEYKSPREEQKNTLEKTGNTCPVAKSLHPDLTTNILYNWQ